MSRVPIGPLDPDVLQRLRPYHLPDGRPLALFFSAAHHPAVLDDLRRATTTCLRDLGLPVRDRELVILRTLARAGAEAEWSLHAHLFAVDAGLDPDDVAATCGADLSPWTTRDRALLEMADACHDGHGVVGDDLWNRWRNTWSAVEIMALFTVAGQYRTVAVLTNALALPVPAGLPRFPEGWPSLHTR